MMVTKKDVRKLLDAAEAQGFEIVRTRGGHYRVYLGGDYVVTVGGTVSDYRAYANTLARLKRAGFEWPPPRRRR
jgi:hypothetical protein